MVAQGEHQVAATGGVPRALHARVRVICPLNDHVRTYHASQIVTSTEALQNKIMQARKKKEKRRLAQGEKEHKLQGRLWAAGHAFRPWATTAASGRAKISGNAPLNNRSSNNINTETLAAQTGVSSLAVPHHNRHPTLPLFFINDSTMLHWGLGFSGEAEDSVRQESR